MSILVQVEHFGGKASESVHELLAMAKSLGGPVDALVCAGTAEAVATIAAQLDADTVVGVADARLAEYLPSAYLAALNAAIAARTPDVVLISYSTAGIDLAAGAAVYSGRELVGYVSEIARTGNSLSVVSQIFGGKLMAKSNLPLPGIAVIMPGAFNAEGPGSGAAIEMLDVDLPAAEIMSHVEVLEPESSGIDLTKAERIVCVGRAIGGANKLDVAEALAGKLGAEIAGSRPVIDAGWLPKARQIGKSGNKVKPKLYLTAGVSGAPEHLEGMQESELIIALNLDEQAPIFSKAHYGAVCDMFDVLPLLTEKLS